MFVMSSLKGKFGENPTRSRHCKWEFSKVMPLFIMNGKVLENDDHEPGDLPIFHAITLRGYRGCVKLENILYIRMSFCYAHLLHEMFFLWQKII